LEETPRSIITAHPEGMNVCLDAGYVSAQKPVEKGWGIKRTSGVVGKREEKDGRRRPEKNQWEVSAL
jgi:hypothetical protein